MVKIDSQHPRSFFTAQRLPPRFSCFHTVAADAHQRLVFSHHSACPPSLVSGLSFDTACLFTKLLFPSLFLLLRVLFILYYCFKTTEVNKRQLPRNFLLLGEKLQTASFTLSHLLLLSWSAAPWPSFGRHHSFSTGVRSRPLARPDYGGNAESSAAANSGTSSLRSHRRIQRRLGSSA